MTHTSGVKTYFDEWCGEESQAHPQFLYWGKTLELELLLLQYVLAFRDGISNYMLSAWAS